MWELFVLVQKSPLITFAVSVLGGKNEALIARIRSLKSTCFLNYLLIYMITSI